MRGRTGPPSAAPGIKVPLQDVDAARIRLDIDVLALDAALDGLAAIDPGRVGWSSCGSSAG